MDQMPGVGVLSAVEPESVIPGNQAEAFTAECRLGEQN